MTEHDQAGGDEAQTLARMLREEERAKDAAITRLRAERDAAVKARDEAEIGQAAAEAVRDAALKMQAATEKRAEEWKAVYQQADQSRDEWMVRTQQAESALASSRAGMAVVETERDILRAEIDGWQKLDASSRADNERMRDEAYQWAARIARDRGETRIPSATGENSGSTMALAGAGGYKSTQPHRPPNLPSATGEGGGAPMKLQFSDAWLKEKITASTSDPEAGPSIGELAPTPPVGGGEAVNINECVRIRLTDHGRAILRRNHEELFRHLPNEIEYTPPKEDEDGWSEWQLWNLMAQFGPHITMAAPVPFETTIRFRARSSQGGA